VNIMMGRSSMGSQLTGDRVKKMAKGGSACPSCGAMKCACGGKMKKMASGGKMNRGDGCCMKGKTKGRMV
jgi:hypothetical protein